MSSNLTVPRVEANMPVHEVATKVFRVHSRSPSLRWLIEAPMLHRIPGGEIFGGLALFPNGLPITEDNGGARWLALHLAACFGRAGLQYADRMRWVMDRDDLWQRIKKDPLGAFEWAGPGVTDPWSALAAALEWSAFRTEGYGVLSRLPIPLTADNVSALMFETAPASSLAGPREEHSARWVAVAAKTKMVVRDHGAGVYATHAATAGALAFFLGDAAELIRLIAP